MLKDLNKGERFKELPGLIVARVFDPKQGKPQDDGSPGKLRQGLILTDGTAEMSFTLWEADVGQVMKGDQLILKVGWVNAYTTSQGVEKFDLRLRKEGGWAKTGSSATIPQAPSPEPQYVPADRPTEASGGTSSPVPQIMVVDANAREKNINRQSARRDAIQALASGGDAITPMEVLAVARQFYRWAMNQGPHWMEDEVSRKRFWAKLGEAGLDSKDAHRELDVYSMYDFEGTERDALSILVLGEHSSEPEKVQPHPQGNVRGLQKHLSDYIRSVLDVAGSNKPALQNNIKRTAADDWNITTEPGQTPLLEKLNTVQLQEIIGTLKALVPTAPELEPFVPEPELVGGVPF